MKILFVCLGNICRSPLAEEVFRHKVLQAGRAKDFPLIDSAGMIDFHEGERADPRMRQAAIRHGYHLTHLSRPMCKEDFALFDLIVAMDADNVRRLRKFCPHLELMEKVVPLASYLTHHLEFDSIPDPYYGTDHDFDQVIALCEDACTQLLACC